jgi:hypothetical protein
VISLPPKKKPRLMDHPARIMVPIDINHYSTIVDVHVSKDSVKKTLSVHHTPALEPTFE